MRGTREKNEGTRRTNLFRYGEPIGPLGLTSIKVGKTNICAHVRGTTSKRKGHFECDFYVRFNFTGCFIRNEFGCITSGILRLLLLLCSAKGTTGVPRRFPPVADQRSLDFRFLDSLSLFFFNPSRDVALFASAWVRIRDASHSRPSHPLASFLIAVLFIREPLQLRSMYNNGNIQDFCFLSF